MTEEAQEEVKKAPIRDVKLRYGALNVSEHAQTRWGATIPASHTVEDIQRPAYWSILAKRFTLGDIIDIRTEDGRFYIEAYVTGVDTTGISLQIMRNVPLDGYFDGDVETPGYMVVWKSPSWRYCVVRKSDNAVMVKNLPTKEAAADWLEDNKRAA